ncbi:zinc finger protein 420-like [Labeo rohita]|uniref:Zinc finger protein 420-like n=1 Tax=Labeo rohita TaxID=84645 RepID=A0A498LB00_LABRO|nr:zinc finger protein 420-like [Labeo rohita]
MSTDSDKYSFSPDNRLGKSDTAVDEKTAVERREFLKDPFGEASASVPHMLPLRCAQYVTHEKNRELDQGNGNWTSVIKDALEMSNGMEMEQTLSMNECGPLMDCNPIYKGPETEANFRLKDHCQIAGSKVNEKQDGQGVEEPDSFLSVLSDGISKKKDVLEVGKNEGPSILDVGSSLGKKELGITGIREHEPELLPGFNRSSYTPFSSSESLMEREQFPEEDCTSHFQVSDTTLMKGVSNPAVTQQAISSLESRKLQKSGKKTTKKTLQIKDDSHKDVPMTFSELETDVVDVEEHQKERRFPTEASKGKKNETGLLNRQSSLDSGGQTDSVSTSVTESSNNLSPQNNPKKSKQKKRAHVNKGAKTPNVCPQEDMENMMTLKTKMVKAKKPLKKATITDDNETTLLNTQPSTDTVKQVDSVSNEGNDVEPSVLLSTPRKSVKRKSSDTKCKAIDITAVEQTTAQQSVLNPLSESDDTTVQPTIERLRTRKTLDKKVSHNIVGENCELAHLTPETDYSSVSQQNTEKTSSKRRNTDHKFTEAQDNVILPPSDDFSRIVVSNPEKTVKARGSLKNKNDNHLNGNLVEETSLLATVIQESSVLPATTDSSRLNRTLKKPRKKTVTKIKNEAAEMLSVNQHEDLVAVPSKSGANIVASSSQMALKEKRTVEKATGQEVVDDHAVAPSTLTLQQTECSDHSTAKKSKKMSDNKQEAVYKPAVDQTMQQETFVSAAATEMDNSDIKQKKTKVKMKRQPKKATKCKTHLTQAITDIREQFPVQQENSVLNRNANSRSEDVTKKCMKKRTTALEVRNDQPEDHAEHSVLSPPISQSKDATQDPCIKTDTVSETAESHVESQVSITAEDVANPQRSTKKAKKTQSNILELAPREDKMSDVSSVVSRVASENFETDNCDQHLKIPKKKSKKSMEIVETHGFGSVSLSEDKNSGSDEAGVMVTFTQVEDLCKLSDGQTVGSQQSEKDGTVVEQKDLKATKPPKKKGRKAGRKKRKMACRLTQTVKEEEHKDICHDNRIACDFQNNTQIQFSDNSQRITDIPEEPVLNSRKSTRTQKINSDPVVENLSTHGKSTVSSDITKCLGETHLSSMQTAEFEDQNTVEKKPTRRGRPPSKKNKKKKLSVEHLEDNASPSVQISDLSPCQDSTENGANFEDQYTVDKKPPRRGRPPSKKNKKNKLFVAHLEDNTSPSVQISDLSPCQDSAENAVEAAASPVEQKVMDENLIVTKQLGTDPSESLQSATDPLSHSIPTSFNEEGNTSLPLPETQKKQDLCEETAKENGDMLADIKIETKGTIKVLKGRKRGRKRRKHTVEPAKSLLTKFNITSECSTEDKNNIVTPEKNDNEKTKLGSEEMISRKTAGTYKITPKTDVLCSSPTDLSSSLMKEVNEYKVEEHIAEPSGKDSVKNETPSTPPSTRRNHILNLNLDGIPNDDRLYVYSHPDKLYVSPSRRVQLPVINLDPDEPEEVSDSQNPGPELPNTEITSHSDSINLPQATSDQETTNLNSSESIKIMANGQHNYSHKYQRSPSFVETSVDMEVETPARGEDSEESFECADCTEKLTSVLGLYEHYILHAMGDAFVQVH